MPELEQAQGLRLARGCATPRLRLRITDFRANLTHAIETAQTEAVIVERNGHPTAVAVSPERYDQMMEAMEELEDATAVDAAQTEGGTPIPWEQVMKDLGWT